MHEVKESDSNNVRADFVKWFPELNKNSGSVAGGKGANLAEIYNLKVPVPPGFVVTAQAYDYFIEKAGLKEKIQELLDKIDFEDTKQLDLVATNIRTFITDSKFPKELEEEILEAYETLDTDEIENLREVRDLLKRSPEPQFVAVRSSATAEDLADASFAGQQESFLNVKGKSELIKKIKECFASLFTSRAIYYRNKKGFTHKKVSLAVVVQKMINSDKSGVIFSKDPSYNNDSIIIEAVWGLGEGIVSGKITPDRYIVSKDLKLLEKHITDKKIAITRDSSGTEVTVKLREERAKHQVLTDYEIKKLADYALKLEEHYQKPQDIEFAIEGENIFLVQTRPITTMEKRLENSDREKELQGEIILTGLAASPGIGVGKARIIEDLDDLDKIKTGDVLVTRMTNPDMVVTMQKSIAIVTDEGGLTAHAAIVSREMGIPCVVGTQEATTKLKEGELITVDGFTGKIYKGKTSEGVQKEVLPVTAKTKTQIKVVVDLPSYAKRASKTGLTQVGLTRIEGIIAESGKHPNYFLKNNRIKDYENIIYEGVKGIAKYFEEIWVRTSDIRSDEFENLEGSPKEKEANPMLGMHGIRFGLKHPEILKAELNALKRVSEEDKKIGVLIPQVILVDEVKKVKGILKEIGFSNAKVGIMVETPAAVQIIRELCEEGIDFISFGTNDLTQYILAIDRGNKSVQDLYNEMNPAILYQLEYVIRVCKRNQVETSICGQAANKKEMVKFLIEKGIDSISLNADAAKEISDYVSELEHQITLGTDLEPRKYQPEIRGAKPIVKETEEMKEQEEELLEEVESEYKSEPTYIKEDSEESVADSSEEENIDTGNSDEETPEFENDEEVKDTLDIF